MTALLIVLALLALLIGGTVAFFTVGTIGAILLVLLIFALAGAALYLRGAVLKAALAATAVIALGAAAFGGVSAFELVSGLRNYEGTADPANPAALASGEAKLDHAKEQAGFRVELTEDELTAMMQDALGDSEENPIRSVDLTIVDGGDGEQGSLNFDIVFKNGSLTGNGRVTASLDAGAINIEIQKVSLGRLSLPGLASGAVEEIIDTVLDLNERLAESQADVQSISIGGGSVVVTGTQGGGEILTAGALLSALQQNAASLSASVTPPSEQIGPGSVGATTADGSTYIVAIGDSLAANVGVTSPREGYVSRFHKVVAGRDGGSVGLRNFGVSGETSGTLIRSGQLEEALAFIRANDVAYVTIDIGANDLLGHLGSGDCSQSIADPACQDRLAPALEAYRANLDRILGDIRSAAGEDTPILLLQTYNPFSLGLGSLSLEAASNEATDQLNEVAAEVAAEHEVIVADGATPMRGTTGATTHMLDATPDVHPNSVGYDLLAQALVDALP